VCPGHHFFLVFDDPIRTRDYDRWRPMASRDANSFSRRTDGAQGGRRAGFFLSSSIVFSAGLTKHVSSEELRVCVIDETEAHRRPRKNLKTRARASTGSGARRARNSTKWRRLLREHRHRHTGARRSRGRLKKEIRCGTRVSPYAVDPEAADALDSERTALGLKSAEANRGSGSVLMCDAQCTFCPHRLSILVMVRSLRLVAEPPRHSCRRRKVEKRPITQTMSHRRISDQSRRIVAP